MFGIVALVELQPARSFLFPTQPAFQQRGCDSPHCSLGALFGRCQCTICVFFSGPVKVQ